MSGSTWLPERGSAAQAPPACRPPEPRPRCCRRGPAGPPGSAGGRRTKSGAGGCPAEQQKVVPTTPAPMLFDVASRPPRGGLSGRPGKESHWNAPRRGLSPPTPLCSPRRSPGVSKQRQGVHPHFLSYLPERGCPGRGFGRAQGHLGRASRRRAARILAPLRERKRLNEELRGGSGAPGEEASGWKQTLASREPWPERRGREGRGGARGALTCPFLLSLASWEA